MKRRPSHRSFAIALALLAGLPIAAVAVHVVPGYQVLTVKAGGKAASTITITNNDTDDYAITPSVSDWYRFPQNPGIAAEHWLSMDGKPFPLKVGESRVVPFKVHLPTSTVGEVVGMLSFVADTPQQSQVALKVSVAVYGAAKGTEKVAGSVTAFSVRPSSMSTSVAIQVAADGNVHVRPTGWVQILPETGEVPVANLFVQRGPPVYPGRPQQFIVQDGAVIKPGSYRIRISLQDNDRGPALPVFEKRFVYGTDGKVTLQE